MPQKSLVERFPATKIGKYTVHYTDHQEFSILKKEIFAQNCYHFETENPTPVIFDIGAHIGLSTLYFKQLYPGATIECFEPHPDLIPLLEHNIWINDIADVYIHPVALGPKGQTHTALHWDTEATHWLSTSSTQPFHPHGARKKGGWETVEVPSQPLSDFLEFTTAHTPVDLIKLDVEGAEGPIVYDAAPYFSHIKKWLIEFHPRQSSFSLEQLEKLLSSHYSLNFWQSGQQVDRETKGLLLIEATKL